MVLRTDDPDANDSVHVSAGEHITVCAMSLIVLLRET